MDDLFSRLLGNSGSLFGSQIAGQQSLSQQAELQAWGKCHSVYQPPDKPKRQRVMSGDFLECASKVYQYLLSIGECKFKTFEEYCKYHSKLEGENGP